MLRVDSAVGGGSGFALGRCGGCDEDPLSLFSVENVLHCQKVSDLLISLAYFSIPLELLYFVTCAAIFPFRWIFVQFGAFIVLCGLTHFAAVFTYAPHSFLLVVVLTALKFLTALVSVATAITLLPLIPQVLRVFVREGLLRKKTRFMDREVGLMKRQEEDSWRVRELVREVRRSLDRRTVVDTAVSELAKLLLLESCAFWVPEHFPRRKLVLRHEARSRRRGRPLLAASVPADDREVADVLAETRVVFLRPSSRLFSKDDGPVGPGIAVRTRVNQAHDFAVLVLALPKEESRAWTPHELEIVETVADEVSVALSQSAVLEETLAEWEKVKERNAALKREQRRAQRAEEARAQFRRVMSREMMGPVRAVAAAFSALQMEKLKTEQQAMARGGLVLSSLVQDMTELSAAEEQKPEVSLRPFALRPALVEAVAMSKLLCCCRRVKFDCTMAGKIPAGVVGDERRVVEAVLCMVSHLLGSCDRGYVSLRVFVEEGSQGMWKQGLCEEFVKLVFEARRSLLPGEEDPSQGSGHGRGITICEHLVRMMNGSLSVGSASQSLGKVMSMAVKLQRRRSRELGDVAQKRWT
ncbi:ethylene receptor 2-like [Wolffia australiana]